MSAGKRQLLRQQSKIDVLADKTQFLAQGPPVLNIQLGQNCYPNTSPSAGQCSFGTGNATNDQRSCAHPARRLRPAPGPPPEAGVGPNQKTSLWKT